PARNGRGRRHHDPGRAAADWRRRAAGQGHPQTSGRSGQRRGRGIAPRGVVSEMGGTPHMREMWINGALRAGASGQTIPVQDPATEEIIDHVPAGNAEDVRAAVDAASAAFRDWRLLAAGERAEMLHEVAAKLTAKTEELATLL